MLKYLFGLKFSVNVSFIGSGAEDADPLKTGASHNMNVVYFIQCKYYLSCTLRPRLAFTYQIQILSRNRFCSSVRTGCFLGVERL